MWTIVKEVGNSILDGRDLSTLTLPIDLFEPCSFLEKMCVSWSYAPTFLTAAAHATDPVERLKLVMSFVLAGIHLAPAARKPYALQPPLGRSLTLFPGSTLSSARPTRPTLPTALRSSVSKYLITLRSPPGKSPAPRTSIIFTDTVKLPPLPAATR